MEALLAAIRRSCSARVWSQGVRLAREDTVSVASDDDDEIEARVAAPGRPVAPEVVLNIEDIEWQCDCTDSDNACAHVVAAAIAVNQARKSGTPLPTSNAIGGQLWYRFSRQDAGLALKRVIVSSDGSEYSLRGTLSGLLSGREDGPNVAVEEVDLQADLLLGTRVRGTLASTTLLNLMKVIADHPRVVLDGRRIEVSKDESRPHAVVKSRAGGARVTIERDPRITDVVTVGLALGDGRLYRLAETDLSGGMLERLPDVRDYSRAQLGDLHTEVLPALKRRIDVDTSAYQSPTWADDIRPRIEFKIDQDGRRLTVLPTLVYGEPACARIDGDRMVHLSGPVPARDLRAEKRVLDRLRDVLDLAPGRVVVYEGQESAVFRQRHQAYLGRAPSASNAMAPAFALVPRVRIDGDRFDIYFETAWAGSGEPRGGRERAGIGRRVDAERVLQAWRDDVDAFFEFGNRHSGWARPPADWLARFGDRVEDLLTARSERGQLPRHAMFDLAQLCTELDHPAPPGFSALKPLFEDFESLPEPRLPDDLTATLRPYQRVGVAWLSFIRNAGLGGLLADDMGLGKTLQALCAVRGKTLVVCPTSVLHNWAKEARRFRPSLSVTVYHGPRRVIAGREDVVITSYALMRIDIDKLEAIAWDTVVLDEAQAIKNADSQAARAAYRLQANFRLTLSGTPVENRLEELWSQMHFTNRGLLGGRRAFKKRYEDPIMRGDGDAARQLRARIRPFLLRRLKRDVAPELPPRTDAVLHCELDRDERDVYDAIRASTHEHVLRELSRGGSVMAALEALLRLRQAACHAALVPGQNAFHDRISSKIKTLLDALELVAAGDHRALVFSQWTSLLDLIEPWLKQSGIDWVRLDGATRNRAAVVDEFQREDGPPVMLISLKAGGTGLNLTAADHVFLCDPWWNPAVEDQAADRTHRIGQERPVMVYRLVARDTVEERIVELQERKRALADAALDGADGAANLTRDDLMALLEA